MNCNKSSFVFDLFACIGFGLIFSVFLISALIFDFDRVISNVLVVIIPHVQRYRGYSKMWTDNHETRRIKRITRR